MFWARGYYFRLCEITSYSLILFHNNQCFMSKGFTWRNEECNLSKNLLWINSFIFLITYHYWFFEIVFQSNSTIFRVNYHYFVIKMIHKSIRHWSYSIYYQNKILLRLWTSSSLKFISKNFVVRSAQGGSNPRFFAGDKRPSKNPSAHYSSKTISQTCK